VADVTALLIAWRQGESGALDRLAPIVYDDLRVMARRCLRRERPDHSLQATALVNEAFLRLVDVRQVKWQDRAHFFAMSARMMRRILVDSARRRRYQKRGGGAARVTLDDAMLVVGDRGQDLVALDDALQALAAVDARKSQVVELRFFGGLAVEEIAEALQVSSDTVTRDWNMAKVWLLRELKKAPATPSRRAGQDPL
jgi:RNA polymerase sigma-70 factor (ECF subfamily)